jgi:hypothetical protein
MARRKHPELTSYVNELMGLLKLDDGAQLH